MPDEIKRQALMLSRLRSALRDAQFLSKIFNQDVAVMRLGDQYIVTLLEGK